MKKICFLIAAFSACLAVPALAGPREEVMESAAKCASVAGDKAWLDCYMAAAAPMQAALNMPAAPDVVATGVRRRKTGIARIWDNAVNEVTKATPQTPEQFGFTGFASRVVPRGARTITRVTSRAKAYAFSREHSLTIVLENGQTWRQHFPDSRIDLDDPAGNYMVTIARAGSGSFYLTIPGIDGSYQMERME